LTFPRLLLVRTNRSPRASIFGLMEIF
jgi:hypothetical protein